LLMPPTVTPGSPLQTLLLCTRDDKRRVDELARLLRNAGQQVEVQPFSPEPVAVPVLVGALKSAVHRAPLVLLAVSPALQRPLAELLAGELAEVPAAGRWLVLVLDEGGLEPPASVEVIAWPRQGRGKQNQRKKALARIVELAKATPEAALASSEVLPKPQERTRDNFTKEIRTKLYQRVGGFCSRPGCPHHTTGPHSQPDKATDTGVAAHITAAARGGPRYNPSITSTQRKSADNGIWLCQICAKLIDSDPDAHPESVLREWKVSAEEEQRSRQLGIQHGLGNLRGPGGARNLAQGSIPHNLPEPATAGAEIVGRDQALKRLEQLLAAGGGPVLITGMDGVGKTTLALHHLRQKLEQYGGGVVLLDGRLPLAGLVAQLEQFALVHFDLPVPESLPKQARLGWLYSHWPRPQAVLLLVDELQDPLALEALGAGLPPRFRLLVTSSRKFGVAAQRVPLEPLAVSAGVALLEQLGERGSFSAAHRRYAQAIAEEVGGWPLALQLLGRQLARDQDLELAALLQRLRQRGALARELQGSTADPLQARGLRAGFQLIWEALSPLEQGLGLLLAELPPAAVPWELLARCCPPEIDPYDWEEARLVLEHRHLIERPFPRLLEFHPLLHDLFVAQAHADEAGGSPPPSQGCEPAAELEQQERRKRLKEALVPWLEEFSDVLEARSRERQQHCLPLLRALAQWPAERWPGAAIALPQLAQGRLLSGLGAYGGAEEALERALVLLLQIAKPEKAVTEAGCLVALSGIARERGQLREAEAQCRQALAGLDAAGVKRAGSALARAAALNGLGLALHELGHSEAETVLREALELRLQELDNADRLVQISRTNLARTLRMLGHGVEAEELYEQVLAALEDEPCEVGVTARNNLSFLAEDSGQLERAHSLREEAVALAALALGEEHPRRGLMLMNLGHVAEQLGRLADADDHYRRAAQLTAAAWGPEHPLSLYAQETLETFLKSDAASP
jgi:tetratricopeptide (TPR) repeat protein